MEQRRPETGPMEFGADWPGVFIRGDNAMHFCMVLEMVQASLETGVKLDVMSMMQFKGLVQTLASSRVSGKGGPEIQRLKPWDQCVVPSTVG